jgi:hypothetical protein
MLKIHNLLSKILNTYLKLVGLPSFAWDFFGNSVSLYLSSISLSFYFSPLSLCLSMYLSSISLSFYFSPLSLCLSISPIYLPISPLYLSISPIYLSVSPLYLSLSLSPSPSPFPDKKFPALGPSLATTHLYT